ncbi:MAG TPA: phage major capsid protein [Alphaproteobacteria bacterium]|nr:phage major capsid protein [Alphaproteobacteria bacterium]HAJ48512.1 phage major capsid protein [Alphaproteobacteria bacterium]
MDADGNLETKAGSARAHEPGTTHNIWEEFKAANDQRLDEIERRLSADVLLEEKVERLNRALDTQKQALDEMALSARRPQLDGVRTDRAGMEHKAAWDAYMRKGDSSTVSRIELKSAHGQSGPDGGYLVPSETEAMIDKLMAKISPVRAIASVRQISAASFKKPFATTGAAAGWVGEVQARTETATPALSVIEFPAMELYAMPAATQSLLDDTYVNVEQWLADEVQTEFAEQEGQAFISGDGVNRPRGLTTYPFVANASWSWGKVGYIATGNAGDFAASNPSDSLIDLIYAVRQSYRMNGRWLMNRTTQAKIRKLRDGDGTYLWQPSSIAGEPATLMGFPVAEAEDMPDIAANSYAVLFGDFQRGYLVVDRAGVRVLRDPYSAKPYVLFYTTKRVGGGIQNFEAIKAMKFAAS